MNRTFYLVDNNALIALTRRRVETEFFADHCRITAAVLREGSAHPERRGLGAVAGAATSDGLGRGRVVMGDCQVGGTD